MAHVTYTRKEADAIATAWGHVERLALYHNRAQMLEDAYRHERRQRQSVRTAKAVLIRCVLDGWIDPTASVADLFGISWGCMWARVFGAYMYEFQSEIMRDLGEDVLDKFFSAGRTAIAADDAHTRRMIESI